MSFGGNLKINWENLKTNRMKAKRLKEIRMENFDQSYFETCYYDEDTSTEGAFYLLKQRIEECLHILKRLYSGNEMDCYKDFRPFIRQVSWYYSGFVGPWQDGIHEFKHELFTFLVFLEFLDATIFNIDHGGHEDGVESRELVGITEKMKDFVVTAIKLEFSVAEKEELEEEEKELMRKKKLLQKKSDKLMGKKKLLQKKSDKLMRNRRHLKRKRKNSEKDIDSLISELGGGKNHGRKRRKVTP